MTVISKSELAEICRQVSRDYPEYQDVSPKISQQSDGKNLLLFETKQKTEDGFEIKLTLRVTVDENGKILKVSSSK